jgi:alpha-ketoglutarate-dependent 2,4-dichlorophenoxyacetate dioxygenase
MLEDDAVAYQINRLHPLFAAEVIGLDLSAPATTLPARELKAAIDTYGVLVYRNPAPPSDAQHVNFSRLFGPVEVGPTFKVTGDVKKRINNPALVDVGNLDAEGNIMALDNRRRLFRMGDRLWHADMSFMQNRATYSLLLGHEIPPEGGDTEFADMRAAHDALPDKMKALIEDLTVEHSIWHSRRLAGFPEPTREELESRPPAYHKLVHVHPGSRRKVLYLAAHASQIVDWPIELGRGLIKNLMHFATQPQFVYRHPWKLGDLVMWDNLSTMHRATEFDDTKYRRDMRRATCREQPVDLSAAA